jgi:hypothetical protein
MEEFERKNLLFKKRFAVLYYSIVEEMRRGGLNMSGTVSGNGYV